MTDTANHAVDACAIRLQIAQDIVAAYAAESGVVAIFVGGSVARGWADHWSDVELCVVWSAPPTVEQRRDALRAAPISRHRAFADPSAVGALEEEFVAAEIKVDVAHMTVAAIDGVIHDVIDASDPDLAKQALLATLLVAIPLHGHETVETWRRQAAHYPDALALAMVARNLAFGPHYYLTMLAERDDLLLLSDILCRVVRSILAVTDAQRLIDETLSLVETHLPAFDITRSAPASRTLARHQNRAGEALCLPRHDSAHTAANRAPTPAALCRR